MDNLTNPMVFKVEDELLYTKIEGKEGFTPLGISKKETDVISEEIRTKHATIKSHYRDHTDLENGSWNFISPSFRYIGWYTKSLNSTKQDHIAGNKKYVEPIFVKKIVLNKSNLDELISSLTDRDILPIVNVKDFFINSDEESITSINTIPTTPLLTQRQLIGDNLLKNDLNDLKDSYGITKSIKSRSIDAFYTMNIFTNIYDNYSTYDFTTQILGALGQNNGLELSMMLIDWATMPEDSYFIAGLLKDKIDYKYAVYIKNVNNITKEIPESLEDIKTNIYKTSLVNDSYYKLLENEEPFYDGFYKFNRNDKVKAKKRYTYILIISESPKSKPKVDSSNGLFFNFYFPEKHYFEVVRDLYNNSLTHILSYSNVGKLYNGLHNYRDYFYYPTFPKNGDTITLIESLNKDNTTKESKYLVMQGASLQGIDEYEFRNPSKDKHFNIGYARYPVGRDISSYIPNKSDINLSDNNSMYISLFEMFKNIYYSIELKTPDGRGVSDLVDVNMIQYIKHLQKLNLNLPEIKEDNKEKGKEVNPLDTIDFISVIIKVGENIISNTYTGYSKLLEGIKNNIPETESIIEIKYVNSDPKPKELFKEQFTKKYGESLAIVSSKIKEILIKYDFPNENYDTKFIDIYIYEVYDTTTHVKKNGFSNYLEGFYPIDYYKPLSHYSFNRHFNYVLKNVKDINMDNITDSSIGLKLFKDYSNVNDIKYPITAGIIKSNEADRNNLTLNFPQDKVSCMTYDYKDKSFTTFYDFIQQKSSINHATDVDLYFKTSSVFSSLLFLPILSINRGRTYDKHRVLNTYSYLQHIYKYDNQNSLFTLLQNYIDKLDKYRLQESEYSERMYDVLSEFFESQSGNLDNMVGNYRYNINHIYSSYNDDKYHINTNPDNVFNFNECKDEVLYIDVLKIGDKYLNSDDLNLFNVSVTIEYLSDTDNSVKTIEKTFDNNSSPEGIIPKFMTIENNTKFEGSYDLVTFKVDMPLGYITKVSLSYIVPIDISDDIAYL